MSQTDMQHSIKEMEYMLWGVGVILILTSFWYGMDFLISVAIGVVIVALNFALTRKAVRQVLTSESHAKNKMLFLYLLKIGISAILIYFAIFQFGISAIGILIGLSSLFIAVILHTVKRILFH